MIKNNTMTINQVKSTNFTVNHTMLNNIINKINQDILFKIKEKISCILFFTKFIKQTLIFLKINV